MISTGVPPESQELGGGLHARVDLLVEDYQSSADLPS